ncbi:calcium-dependent lipid-binding (CaLB domain) family protein isoform X2 [Tasmannia lanceolata]
MAKIRLEVCLISARGLRRSSSLWKLQWFAVGWIDPQNKYCSKIDGSGSSNPSWKTKFSALFDDSNPNLNGLVLNIEVYSREPIFLREKLHGTATVLLKEFFAKFKNSEGQRSAIEEVGSFQLRRKNSDKPQGVVDISVRIIEERSSYSGTEEGGFKISDQKNGISLDIEDGSASSYPIQPIPTHVGWTENYPHPIQPIPTHFGRTENYPPMNFPYAQPMSLPANYSNPSGPTNSYPRPRTPPPPPPPSHVGFVPTFLPGTAQLPESYINMPSSSAGGRPGRPGFGMGVGAGAMAAGAVIFGDDFMSGFDLPTGFQGGSLTVSADPPF